MLPGNTMLKVTARCSGFSQRGTNAQRERVAMATATATAVPATTTVAKTMVMGTAANARPSRVLLDRRPPAIITMLPTLTLTAFTLMLRRWQANSAVAATPQGRT